MKLIDIFCAMFPMYEILVISVIIVVISVLYLQYKLRVSIEAALTWQFVWFLVPILYCLAYLSPQGLDWQICKVTAHIGSGIVFGQIFALGLYAASAGLKKVFN